MASKTCSVGGCTAKATGKVYYREGAVRSEDTCAPCRKAIQAPPTTAFTPHQRGGVR